MKIQTEQTVFAVQWAFLELLELAASACSNSDSATLAKVEGEVQETMLAFIAEIICVNGFEDDENLFLTRLIDWHGQPENNVRLVNGYAAKWALISKQVPHFFEAALQHDKIHYTEIAKAMLRSIQLIGNNACVSDKKAAHCELQTVREYISLLERFDAAT